MHRRALGRRSHGGERVIHVLTTCFVGAQGAEGRRVTHGNERAEGVVTRGAEQLSLRGVTSKVDGFPVASDKVLEVRLPLRALQVAHKLVEVVVEKEGAIGQARAVVKRPSEAHRQAMTGLGELQQVLSRLGAALEGGHDHELAPPRGLGGKNAEFNEVKVCQLEGQELGYLISVKGEGFEAVVGRRAK
eukprot:2481327-Pleurochrysis_carterae.AAC.3